MSVRTDDDDKGAALGVQVIARAASVLRALEGKPDGLSLGEIARAVGLARSTVLRGEMPCRVFDCDNPHVPRMYPPRTRASP